MRRAVYLASLLCCLARVVSGQPDLNAKLSLEDRSFIASKIYALVQHFVFGVQASDSDLDSSYKDYLRRILMSDDRREFDFSTMEFVARLHNGHTLFRDSWLGNVYGQPLGFYAAPLDGKWVVRTSALGGLKSGDVIAAIDKIGVDDFVREHQKYIAASNEAAQQRNLFLLPYLFPEQFSLILGGGRVVSINRASVRDREDDVEGRWLKSSTEVAYVRIPSFFSPLAEQRALGYISQFQKAKALIIDVRSNPGGIPPSRLIGALMDRPYRGWRESTVLLIGALDYNQPTMTGTRSDGLLEYAPYMDALTHLGDPLLTWSPRFVRPNPTTAYRGTVVLLVDGGCVSACEDFVEPFKDNGRAVIVGETTEGSSGIPFFYDFGNGMTVKIAVKRDYLPDGSEFEGIGIKPDIAMTPSIEDLKQGRDVVLQKALDLAEAR